MTPKSMIFMCSSNLISQWHFTLDSNNNNVRCDKHDALLSWLKSKDDNVQYTSPTLSVFLVLTIPPSPQGVTTPADDQHFLATAGKRKQPQLILCNRQRGEWFSFWGCDVIVFGRPYGYSHTFVCTELDKVNKDVVVSCWCICAVCHSVLFDTTTCPFSNYRGFDNQSMVTNFKPQWTPVLACEAGI